MKINDTNHNRYHRFDVVVPKAYNVYFKIKRKARKIRKTPLRTITVSSARALHNGNEPIKPKIKKTKSNPPPDRRGSFA